MKMKKVVLFLSVSFFSCVGASEMSKYMLKKDKIIRGGGFSLSIAKRKRDVTTIEVRYNVLAKVFFTKKRFQGRKLVELPTVFLSPYGFSELEKVGRYSGKKVVLVYRGRVNAMNEYDCHKIKVSPRKKTVWSAEFTYCEGYNSIGIIAVRVDVKDAPLFGQHSFFSELASSRL